MIENPRAGRFTCFNLAIVILILLFIGSLGLLIRVGGEAWRTEQAFNTQRDELRRQFELWRSQEIHDYTVNYSNCQGGVCCTDAQMVVERGAIQSITPDCSNIPMMQNYDRQARSVSEFYFWLDQEFRIGVGWEKLEIEYHPEFHYVTRLVWQRHAQGTPLEIRYDNLEPKAP